MNRGITRCGIDALDLIFETHIASKNLRIDLARNDATAGHGAVEKNRKYNAHVEQFVARSMVCLAVDAYHLYLQHLLALLLEHSDKARQLITPKTLPGLKGQNASEVLESLISATNLRKAIHEILGIHFDAEVSVICETRNVLAHHDGKDRCGKLGKAFNTLGELDSIIWPRGATKTALPVFLNEESELRIDFALGDVSCELMHNQIHMMDQNASFMYGLPTERYRPRSISRAMGHFGVPFRHEDPIVPSSQPKPTTAIKAMEPRPTPTQELPPGRQAEISFSQTRCRLEQELLDFIEAYLVEAKLEMTGRSNGPAGVRHGHTIMGHDFAIDYHFLPPDAHHDAQPEYLGVRIRHESWNPKVTVWSTKGMMEDFMTAELHDPLKEKIRTCMDQAFRKA